MEPDMHDPPCRASICMDMDTCGRKIAEPSGAPAILDAPQRQKAVAGHARQQEKAAAVGTSQVLENAQESRQQEAPEAASGADDPRHGADLPAETLRHELKHGAVPHSQAQHAQEQEDGHGGQWR